MAAGVSSRVIENRLAVLRMHHVHAGVYAVGHRLHAPAHYLAAVLACGPHAVLSHRAAAALWDLRPAPSGRVDVTIPRGGSRRRAGIAVHAARSLRPAEITTCDGIPCTTPARTLIDLAAVVSHGVLERALEQSLVLRLYDHSAVEEALTRAGRRRGTARLRRLVHDLGAAEPPPVRSELERRFLDLVRRARLPPPVVNAIVAGYEVDFHWPGRRLILETDGRATHDTPYAFERDRNRDFNLELAGWHVLRITWRQVANEPSRVTELLRGSLQAARTSSEIAPR